MYIQSGMWVCECVCACELQSDSLRFSGCFTDVFHWTKLCESEYVVRAMLWNTGNAAIESNCLGSAESAQLMASI